MKEKINIVCVGSNIESMLCLQKFKANNITISGLVTLPFQKQKRGSDYRDLTPFCNKNSIPFFRTTNINSSETKKWLSDINPDYIFILGWSQIFDKELIDLPKQYIIGSHPSDLPYGAGRAPVVWTILEDLRKSAVSFFKITKEVDAGNLVLQKHFKIDEGSNSSYLYKLISKNLAAGFLEISSQILASNLQEKKQDLSQRTIRKKRVFLDGKLEFSNSAIEVDKLIRATTEPYPGAFSYYNSERYTFWKSKLSYEKNQNCNEGEILKIENNRLLVQCKKYSIWLYDISDSNENSISVNIFKVGKQFGLVL
mgnify:CR=1 FL=1